MHQHAEGLWYFYSTGSNSFDRMHYMQKRFTSILCMLTVCATFTLAATATDSATPIPTPGNNTLAATSNDKTHDALEKLHAIILDTKSYAPNSLTKYRDWVRAHENSKEIIALYSKNYSSQDDDILAALETLNTSVSEAETYADAVLSASDFDKKFFHDRILAAVAGDTNTHSLAVQAVERITDAWKRADAIAKTRDALLVQYHSEAKTGTVSPGTRMAWSLVRIGAANPELRVVPGSFSRTKDNAAITIKYQGTTIVIDLDEKEYRERFRANVNGYKFRSGWPVLFQKPLWWMIETARNMQAAGITPEYQDEWEIMEAPKGLVALSVSSTNGKREIPLRAFYNNALRNVSAIPAPGSASAMTAQFRDAARNLHDGIMADETISLSLRHALEPILLGTYNPIDKRDYFDNDFCRRLIEANYLEYHIKALAPERKTELKAYRDALEKIEAGLDRFSIDLDEDGVLIAVSKPEIDIHNGEELDTRDPETGENLSPWQWRWQQKNSTLFHSPMPGRSLYGFSILENYDGVHHTRPVGVPAVTEVWHPVIGNIVSYKNGAGAASGDAKKWLEAVALDAKGRRDTNSGTLGWNFPLYVPVRDDQGDPVLIATLNGVVTSPHFPDVSNSEDKRRAHDEWLDKAAHVLKTPGELALIYHIFFRYCSDSPLPEMPNLIGSYRGLSDTHQTVYQSLDRRWVGRLIGDCDDLAEFFQNLAVRQGKLAHVMQLPAHAAAGWLEENPDGGYQFIVLQSGPVQRFTADSKEGAVEKAYHHFEDETGATQYTAAAVPLLLRFGDDDTRTGFVLSSRIYWDKDYAEKMITVQEYWHRHTYSAAIKIMEEMIRHDREVGNIKELASLYEMVGQYDKSAAMRRQELDAVDNDPQASLSTLLDIAQLHVRDKNKDRAMEALSQMEDKFREWRNNDPPLYERSLSFRSSWAAVLSRLEEPERAWRFLRPDVEKSLRNDNKLSDTTIRTLLTLYDRMSLERDAAGDRKLARDSVSDRYRLRTILSQTFGKGYFKADDTYNKIHSRYFMLGRYGVAAAGRLAGLQALCQDGPYPQAPRAHAERTEDLSDEDWEWFRIMPRLYLAFGLEMLDKEDFPLLYNPEGAKRCLEMIRRAIAKGTGLGSNVMGRDSQIKGDLILAFVNHDLAAFEQAMEQVRECNYSSLFDDAALVFGSYCGLVPENEFDAWITKFHSFFPKRQHYFKAAYRSLDKGHYDHAVRMGDAAATYFSDDLLMVDEAAAVRRSVEHLRRIRREGGWDDRDWAGAHADVNFSGAVAASR